MSPEARNYFRSLSAAEKRAICNLCNIGIRYLYNSISNPKKRFSIPTACKIEMLSKGRVTRRMLRPDIDWDLLDAPK